MSIEKHGVITVMDEKGVRHRKMTNEEINKMIGKIRLNDGFSLPDKLVQDFINDGTAVPTFKKCVQFNRRDFQSLVSNFQPRKRKRLPPRKTKRKKRSSKKTKKRT